eukprot:6340809-Amphidinium_carterae.1
MTKHSRKKQRNRQSVLAAVQKDWQARQSAAESFREDRGIVLAAVKQDWRALECAAAQCRAD